MAKKYTTKEAALWIALLVGVFYVFFSLNTGTQIMSVEYYNGVGDFIGEDHLEVPKSVQISQSLFKNRDISIPFLLESTVPIEQQSETEIVFRAEILNPFPERAQLLYATWYKNGEQLGDKRFLQYYMEPNDMYLFKSIPIELKGIEAERNILKIVFTFEDDEKNRQEVVYEYHYLYLTQCVGDSQCSIPNVECDIHNKARFSTDPNIFYCTKPCNNNEDCPTDQLCLQGACGY